MTIPVFLLAALAIASPSSPTAVKPDSLVIADSIYRLAVDPAAHPNDAVVMLLDEGVYRVEADGRNSRTIRQVIQILKDDAAESYREQRLSYDPSFQKLTVNWMRVVKPNGQVVMDHPLQVQDSDIPAEMGTPMYTAMKVKRMSLSGLDSGTILDYSYTMENFNPYMKGDFFFPWRVNTGLPVVRSNMVVDVPVGLNPRIWEKSLTFKRSERVAGGRKTYTWATSNVPVVKIEPYTPDSLIPVGRITVTAPFDWRAVAKWYSGLVQPAYNVTPTVADKISKVVDGARTLDDSIRAVHKWVSQDIRYVAIELGRGGYVPRDPETVVRTGFGDCKDKTMLFLAALKKMGVTGYPVLLNLVGTVRQESPAIEQFNHVIAAVQRDKGYVFSDLTAESYPFGVVPGEEQGKFAVMVKNDGGDEVHLPTAELGPSRFTERIVGELTDSGMFNGVFAQIIEGSEATVFRRLFSRPSDSTRRASFARMIASSRFPGADGDSLQMSDEKNSSSAARMSVHIRNGKVMSSVGNVHLLTNPNHPMTSFTSIASTLERGGKRTMPIDLGRILHPALETAEIKLTLPPGWTASLPKNKSMSGPFGRYEEVYAQNGRELTISRTIDGAKGVLPADKMGDLIAWLKFIGNDDAKLIVLQKP